MANRVCLKHTVLHPECFPLKGNVQIALVALPLIATEAAEFCFGLILHANISALLVPERLKLRPKRPNTLKHYATANASVNCFADSIAINANFGARSTSEIRSSCKG